ncbi:ATP-binding protein [Allochromatium vinosum]|uniref:histidine kinase n=1 Tax=Allochromatium vinosum (strain ATCC 17899 / DSM 180 / NBRC 103801 / NCIMB 10441 / D) TaxID=572477 RepID=D3RPS7_ALLVD|nr:ATP-binding protein [Allochromatium vinosum]ADC61659.1 multi-sensor hybrid histidine kinase [Allochromatium vinosum DSM 180]
MQPPSIIADPLLCEAEPIHIPGAIQPHGVLLALSGPARRILHASLSTMDWLGIPADRLLGRDLVTALGPELADAVNAALAQPSASHEYETTRPFEWTPATGGDRFAGHLHSSGSLQILELEPSPNAMPRADLSAALADALRGLHALRAHLDLGVKLQNATELFRSLTGHDRVMVYRFDPDWHGEVVAESCRPDLEPYLGLHFPASDIPAQARRIFLTNPLRLIVDVDYRPCPLVPVDDASNGPPLDLSQSLLRSVSPVHLEYLSNMGVRSTLTLSLLREGRLWGLIACHHLDRHWLNWERREIARWMAQDLATQIALAEEVDRRRYESSLRDCRERTLLAMRQGKRLSDLIHGRELDDVLGAIGADGVALIRGDEVFTGGVTPSAPHVRDIARALSAQNPNSPSQLFATDCLSAHLEQTAELAETAAGVALFPLDAGQSIKLIWFRGEQLRQVTWGGNPDKSMSVAADGRLSPRRSFDAWREIVERHGRRWRPEELESARKLGALIDIEWRKMAEEALRASEERLRQAAENALRLSKESFRLAVDHMPDALVIYDQTRRYSFLNAVSLKRAGRPMSAYLGRRDEEIHPPEVCDVYLPHLCRAYANRSVVSFECALELATSHYDLVVTYVPMLEHGEVYQVFGFYYDITERKRNEAKLAEQARQLREADWRKDEFLAMLAHELRNPLAPISNALQLLKQSRFAGQEAWCLAVIDRQAAHLQRLVDDLLDVSRITRGVIELRPEPLDVTEIIDRAVETSRALIEARRHELRIRTPTEPIRLMGDLVRLTQVVSNLLANAAKFTDEGGCIAIDVEREATTVLIRVRDNGLGIEPERLPQLFDLFYQVDRGIARTEGGLGIGLSLVKRLVEMHGGSVEALSPGLGQGAELRVRLPGLPATADTAPVAGSTPASLEPAPTPSRDRRILVVDDNRDAIDSLELLLGGEGYEVLVAYDGETALRLAIAEQPQVVLLDIGLPGMDGYAVARALRRQPGLPPPRIIAITGYSQPESRARSREAGIDVHLVKPVDFAALLALLADHA